MTFDELKAKLWGAAQILRGSIDAGGYKEYVFPLVFFKRICDVHREEYRKALAASGDEEFARLPENYTFAIPEGCDWEDVRTVTANVGQALTTAFLKIEQANPSRQIGERRVEGLEGIFGSSGIWRNKNILSDEAITGLIENFSKLDLSLAACPADEMGNAYEYLVGKFADDAGNTAQEFYTNRTVVELMAEILEPKSGESIYDPTCGTGGMLISCIARCKRHEENWREIKAYGQEQNALTSSVARMNLFLHGVEEFRIVNDDTLLRPGFTTGGALQTFDVVLANPPYSIKQWNRELFANDPYGRNFLGTPPQGRADYAFIQHIFKSMDPVTGRCAILLPHGVLFRDEEAEIRKALIERDIVEAVIGLGPNLFYNSPMEACIMICRAMKSAAAQGRVMFINAVNEVTRKNGESKLEPAHIAKILNAYRERLSDGAFAYDATVKEIADRAWSLNISLYAHVSHGGTETRSLSEVLCSFARSDVASAAALDALASMVGRAVPRAPQQQSNAVCVGGSVAAAKGLAALPIERVKFNDIAINSVAKKKPTPEDAAHYIGLEHIDPGSFEITRWGSDVAPIGDKLLMKKGDVLFGRRRAYQRKVAIAPFDGIFSAHGMVLRPKTDVVDARYFPFFIASDQFMNEAVRISVGGLSPTINWKTLKECEFSLPPLEEQKKFAELLWAANDLKEAYKRMIAATDEMLKAKFREMFGENDECRMMNDELGEEVQGKICEDLRGSAVGDGEDGCEPQIAADCRRSGEESQGKICEDLRGSAVGAGEAGNEPQIAADCRRSGEGSHAEMRRGGEDSHAEPQRRRVVAIGTICDILNGYAFKSKDYVDAGIRVIRITNVQKGFIEDATPAFYPLSRQDEFSKFLLKKDDLLISLTGNVGRVGLLRDEFLPAALNQRVACLRSKKNTEIDRMFLFMILNSDRFEKDCINSANGSAQKNMSTEWLKQYKIPLPPLPLQREFVEIARKAEEAKAALKKSIADVEQVIRGLVNSEK